MHTAEVSRHNTQAGKLFVINTLISMLLIHAVNIAKDESTQSYGVPVTLPTCRQNTGTPNVYKLHQPLQCHIDKQVLHPESKHSESSVNWL